MSIVTSNYWSSPADSIPRKRWDFTKYALSHGICTKLKPVQNTGVGSLTVNMSFVQFLAPKYFHTRVLVTKEVTYDLVGPIFRLEL